MAFRMNQVLDEITKIVDGEIEKKPIMSEKELLNSMTKLIEKFDDVQQNAEKKTNVQNNAEKKEIPKLGKRKRTRRRARPYRHGRQQPTASWQPFWQPRPPPQLDMKALPLHPQQQPTANYYCCSFLAN
uniref:Uncharacterized protein n=1 Tax=Glossina brevipalpis TaxID=37001 RepID=A0A1A9WAB7_9MUSC